MITKKGISDYYNFIREKSIQNVDQEFEHMKKYYIEEGLQLGICGDRMHDLNYIYMRKVLDSRCMQFIGGPNQELNKRSTEKSLTDISTKKYYGLDEFDEDHANDKKHMNCTECIEKDKFVLLKRLFYER